MARYRILQLAAWDYSFQVHLWPLVEACTRAGFEVVCAGAPGPFADELRARGIAFEAVPFERRFATFRHPAALARLVAIMRTHRIDVLHAHTLVAGLLGRMAAPVAGVPISVYTAHGFHFHEHMGAVPYWLFAGCERLGAALTDHLFVQSAEDRISALALRMVRPEQVETIGSGTDLARFARSAVAPGALSSLRRELEIASEDKVVLIVARPTREKGLPAFQAMVERLAKERADVTFVCVLPHLPGERHAALEPLRKSPFAHRLRILGFRRDVRELLALADVFVLPTHFEGLSRIIIEAMAMERAVVTTNVRGCRELVEDGETGWLCGVDDVDALVARVGALLDDAPLRARTGARARAVAERRFDERLPVQRQIETLRGLCARLEAPRAVA